MRDKLFYVSLSAVCMVVSIAAAIAGYSRSNRPTSEGRSYSITLYSGGQEVKAWVTKDYQHWSGDSINFVSDGEAVTINGTYIIEYWPRGNGGGLDYDGR